MSSELQILAVLPKGDRFSDFCIKLFVNLRKTGEKWISDFFDQFGVKYYFVAFEWSDRILRQSSKLFGFWTNCKMEVSPNCDFQDRNSVPNSLKSSQNCGFKDQKSVSNSLKSSQNCGFKVRKSVSNSLKSSQNCGFKVRKSISNSLKSSQNCGFKVRKSVSNSLKSSQNCGFKVRQSV